jgi:hypothetical protein
LLSDGLGYFPDPTLKSGLVMLDAGTQRELHAAAVKHGYVVVNQAQQGLWGVAATAAGIAAAVCGFLWAVLDPRL